jgi:hypothetical protein
MNRYILRFRGEGIKPETDVEVIRSLPHTKVIDEDSPRMLLVEAPKEELETAIDTLKNWMMSEERSYSIPDTRPHVIHNPTRDRK